MPVSETVLPMVQELRTRNDYGNVPMLVGEYACKSMKFNFCGNAVGIAVAVGPDVCIVK